MICPYRTDFAAFMREMRAVSMRFYGVFVHNLAHSLAHGFLLPCRFACGDF